MTLQLNCPCVCGYPAAVALNCIKIIMIIIIDKPGNSAFVGFRVEGLGRDKIENSMPSLGGCCQGVIRILPSCDKI